MVTSMAITYSACYVGAYELERAPAKEGGCLLCSYYWGYLVLFVDEELELQLQLEWRPLDDNIGLIAVVGRVMKTSLQLQLHEL